LGRFRENLVFIGENLLQNDATSLELPELDDGRNFEELAAGELLAVGANGLDAEEATGRGGWSDAEFSALTAAMGDEDLGRVGEVLEALAADFLVGGAGVLASAGGWETVSGDAAETVGFAEIADGFEEFFGLVLGGEAGLGLAEE